IGVRAGSALDTGPESGSTTGGALPDAGRYVPWLERRAEREARSVDAALVHYTASIAPITAHLPYVVTIFDLSVLRDPRHHPPLRVARTLWMAHAAHRARRVIVPSEATCRDVARGLRVPSRRIEVVPLASARTEPPGRRDGDADVLARRDVIPGRYVLATGGLDGRKNPLRLVRALYRLAAPFPALRLVIAGPRGFRAEAIEKAIRTADVDRRVTIAGYVDNEELDVLVRNAAVFSFVSLHEGFGLPILEAMGAGVPVVTSRVSAMPEVAGGAAVLVDPRDVDDIARGLVEAVARRDELRKAGRARAGMRTWHDVARETLDVYGRALR
ncbi:MAG: glycosyltransferase family 4 protein, partial [Chloroflexi bacterium]|nr:glycosyltransferase family 4 protein [Chloroflexota bacterium]